MQMQEWKGIRYANWLLMYNICTEAEGEEENDSPIEEVRMTVSPIDSPNLPVLTIRTWILGILSCVVLAFVTTFFGYRQNSLTVASVVAQILTLPLGKLMAATFPDKYWFAIYKLVVLIKSWTFQSQRACFDHHFRWLWRKWSLCSKYCQHCQSILPQEAGSFASLFALANHHGKTSLFEYINKYMRHVDIIHQIYSDLGVIW